MSQQLKLMVQRTFRYLTVSEADLHSLALLSTMVELSLVILGVATGLLVGSVGAFVYVGQGMPNFMFIPITAMVGFSAILVLLCRFRIAKLKHEIKGK